MSSTIYLAVFLLTILQLLLLPESFSVENVAFKKRALQKSTLYNKERKYYSSEYRAVDGKGRVPGDPEEGCASTADETDTDAWWMVNLQELYVIVNITISGREDSFERLRDFYIRVGNSSDISQHVYCAYKSGWIKLRVRETFRCNRTLVGRWVSIQRTNDKGFMDKGNQGLLQLCEVQVYGYGKRQLPTLYWRNENTARPVNNTNLVRIIFYQFKRGPSAYLDSGDGPVGEYTVDVQEEGSNGWITMGTFRHDDTRDRLVVNLTGLKYYRHYTMRVVPWYRRGDAKFRGRAKSTFTVRTDCGNPLKPSITNISVQIVTGGAFMTVRFMLPKGGHNCAHYRKVDIKSRVFNSTATGWTDKDWFNLTDRRVEVFIDAINITKMHEVLLKVYNNKDKWTDSEIWTFTPITVSTTAPVQTSPNEATISTDRNVTSTSAVNVSKGPTSTANTMADAPGVNIGIIIGPVVAAVVLIILIISLVVLYIRKRNRKTILDEPPCIKENKQEELNKSLATTGVLNPYAYLLDEVDARSDVKNYSEKSPGVKGSAANTQANTDHNPTATSTVQSISQTSSLPVIAPVISPASDPSGDDIEKEAERAPKITRKDITAKKIGIVYANRDSKDYVIPLSEFPKIVADKKQKAAFKDEHESIKDASRSINEGSKPENLNKNKYRNIRAYDHSRVILKKLDDDPHSDYINANYIDGDKKAKAYIAAQGPKEDTVDDFWRMVWEVNANIIVMVTKVVENAKSKTMQYWPEAKGLEASVRFGDINITLDDEQGLADNVTHTLSVTLKGETRRVYHLHFTSWPDKGIPRQAASLLNFRKKVRTYDDKAVGPTIVHCSAGVGRTGTYIALDMLLEQVEEKDEVNIYKTVEKLREQRMNMVQTQGQYIFLHDALIEYLYSVDTSITTPLFKEEYRARLQVNPETGKTKLQEEFLNLAELRVPPAQEKCEGLKPENKKKNREKLIVPANAARPYLMTHVQGRNNYINAVFVDGLVERDMFLVTQHPLPDTVVDFWRMIFDYKCQTIVMLNQTNEKEVPYWPVAGDTEMNIGPFNVEISKLDQSNPAYLIRTMLLKTSNGDKPLEVRQFHLLGWSNKEELPPSIPDLISLVNSVSTWHKKTRKSKVKKNIVVHCLNGNKKSGLFCVAYSVLDQIRFNQDVDVFRAVQVARENRYQFITSTEQYKFCFDVALEFLRQFDTYANFDDQTVKKQQH